MEVFTFLKMTESSPSVPSRPGADGADRIDVIAIAGKDGTAASQGQARQQIAKEFKNFNAAKAQCFKVEDRERLLAVIPLTGSSSPLPTFSPGVRTQTGFASLSW